MIRKNGKKECGGSLVALQTIQYGGGGPGFSHSGNTVRTGRVNVYTVKSQVEREV